MKFNTAPGDMMAANRSVRVTGAPPKAIILSVPQSEKQDDRTGHPVGSAARKGCQARMIFLRIASLAGIIASLVAMGVFVRDKDTHNASLLVFAAVACAILFAWSWRSAYLAPFEWARRYIQGVEGEHRHEWHSFKGWRVRAFPDSDGAPWFLVDDIAPILELGIDAATFRSYGPGEMGSPESASGKCLSVSGLRRLVKYSSHRDAPALGLWLDREVLKMYGNLPSRETV